MTFGRLLARGLWFHRRAHLAVLLGVAVGSAVLTGALLVGDSLRGSLRARAVGQLNGFRAALTAGRFFRQELAGDGVPAVMLRATARGPGGKQVGRVTVIGSDGFGPPAPDGACSVPSRLAAALGVKESDAVTLQLQKVAAVPRESLLGRRSADDLGTEISLRVERVLPPGDPAGAFTVTPSAEEPRNLFVPLAWLQRAVGQPGRANAVLSREPSDAAQESLAKAIALDDWGLAVDTPEGRAKAAFDRLDADRDGTLRGAEVRKLPGVVAESAGRNELTLADVTAWYRRHPYVRLTSRELLLEPAVVAAARDAAPKAGLRAAETLVYLANSIESADGKRSVPYSLVAALDPSLPPPLGRFLPNGADALADDEIVLVDWKQSPLREAKPGDKVKLTYYLPEVEGRLETGSHAFTVRGTIPLDGAAADPDLTPEFPGITDKVDMKGWDPPFPIDTGRIRAADDRFWKDYRTTPKAYVTLAAGQKLWGSPRFGAVTGVRLAPAGTVPASDAVLAGLADDYRKELLARLDPAAGGFVFRDVLAAAERAGAGSVEFGGLFLGFSFFLIAAAVLLVGLLYRLNLDRRASEVGLLLATGFPVARVRRLLAAEGLALAAAGATLGLLGAVAFAGGMLAYFAASWPAGSVGAFLRLHVSYASLLIGWAGSVLVSLFAIVLGVWALGRVPPRALLNGETSVERPAGGRRVRWGRWLAGGSLLAGAGLLAAGPFVGDPMARAGTFFGGGALLLTAFLATAGVWLTREKHAPVRGTGWPAVARLGARNAARNPARSLLTAGLLASAAFVLVAVEAFHRSPEADFLEKSGGSGGFDLLAEADLPLFQNVDTPEGRSELLDGLQKRFQADPAGGPAGPRVAAGAKAVADATVMPLRVRAGQDASCLNLYHVSRPALVGVPDPLIDRGGFRFASSLAATPEERANPWLLLRSQQPDGAVPVIGDANSLTYILHLGLGDTLEVADDAGRPVKLRVVAALADSVFQGQLLMSGRSFLAMFPRQEGYGLFLVESAPGTAAAVTAALQDGLSAHGLTVEPTTERIRQYLAVENTYLGTFQMLGGFGLLLGALGLGVVLLRNAWERRAELALLRALGWRARTLGGLVLAENAFLLAVGLGCGVLAAVLAVLPNLAHRPGDGVWLRLAGLLTLVVVVGLGAGALAVRATLRAPLVPALRRE